MMTAARDLTGLKAGKLTVLNFYDRKNGCRRWLCQCECGNRVPVYANNLVRHNTTSCGCVRRALGYTINRKHGCCSVGKVTPEYRIWTGMKNRCYNKTSSGYYKYGARGITICERWLESFENFLVDMGSRPSKRHSIERRDNNGPYSPDNCYWATLQEQARNKRSTRFITAQGKTQPLQLWALELGCSHTTIIGRINRGWSEEASVTTPVDHRRGFRKCLTSPP